MRKSFFLHRVKKIGKRVKLYRSLEGRCNVRGQGTGVGGQRNKSGQWAVDIGDGKALLIALRRACATLQTAMQLLYLQNLYMPFARLCFAVAQIPVQFDSQEVVFFQLVREIGILRKWDSLGGGAWRKTEVGGQRVGGQGKQQWAVDSKLHIEISMIVRLIVDRAPARRRNDAHCFNS